MTICWYRYEPQTAGVHEGPHPGGGPTFLGQKQESGYKANYTSFRRQLSFLFHGGVGPPFPVHRGYSWLCLGLSPMALKGPCGELGQCLDLFPYLAQTAVLHLFSDPKVLRGVGSKPGWPASPLLYRSSPSWSGLGGRSRLPSSCISCTRWRPVTSRPFRSS